MLNKFDAIILHLMIFAVVLPLIDDVYSPIVIILAFVLVILPLIIFIALTLFLHKNKIKKIVTKCTFKEESPSNIDINNNAEIPMRNFDLVIDNSMRKKQQYVLCKSNNYSLLIHVL